MVRFCNGPSYLVSTNKTSELFRFYLYFQYGVDTYSRRTKKVKSCWTKAEIIRTWTASTRCLSVTLILWNKTFCFLDINVQIARTCAGVFRQKLKKGQHFTRAFIVSDLRQVGGFLRLLVFPPPRYNLNIVNSGVTHHNKTKTPIQAVFSILLLRSDWEASDN